MDKEIILYLVKLSNASLSRDQRETINALLHVVNDIERFGDHAGTLLNF